MSERDKTDKLNHSVMALTTLILIVVFSYLAIAGTLDSGVYANVVTLVVGFWFGKKDGERNGKPPDPAEPQP